VIVLMVIVGGFLGAPTRYLVDRGIQARHDTDFPWGTLVINVAASLLLGFITGLGRHVDPQVAAFVGAGFCGALSTFSTFSYEVVRLTQKRERFYAVAYVGVSLIAGIGAATLGWAFGQAVR
jgi:fluoride exporter